MFGSGTGLSDKDREYAQQMAAGEITMDEASMRWLLEAERKMATQIIEKHDKLLLNIKSTGQVPQATLDLFAIPAVQDNVPAAISRNTSEVLTTTPAGAIVRRVQ